MLAAVGLIAAIALVRALSDHLPLGLSGRQLLARQVDAYDLSHDGKRIILLSHGKLSSIGINGKEAHELTSGAIFSSDYGLPELQLSDDGAKVAVGVRFPYGHSSLKILDVNTGNVQEISKAVGWGNLVWLGDSKQLAWVHHDGRFSEQHPPKKPSLYIWQNASRPTEIYANKSSPRPSIDGLRWIQDKGYIGFIDNQFSVEALAKEQPLDRIRIIRPDGTEVRAIKPPPGRFHPPHGSFQSWDISPAASQVAYSYGWGTWVTGMETGAQPCKIFDKSSLEMHWSPDGNRLAFVIPSPESVKKRFSSRGQSVLWPPHELHVINKDGSGHRLVCTEPQGIKSIEWLNNNEVLYLSGKDLYKRGL